MWCPCENPQYHTSTHFFDVAKNAPSELITFEFLTRTAPKKLRKKCEKSRSGELGSQPFIDNYTLWKRKKATRRDQLWSWRGKMVNARHTDLSVLYTIRLFQKKTQKTREKRLLLQVGTGRIPGPKILDPWKNTSHRTIGNSCFFARFSCFGTRRTRATRVRLADRCALPQARRRDRAGLEP